MRRARSSHVVPQKNASRSVDRVDTSMVLATTRLSTRNTAKGSECANARTESLLTSSHGVIQRAPLRMTLHTLQVYGLRTVRTQKKTESSLGFARHCTMRPASPTTSASEDQKENRTLRTQSSCHSVHALQERTNLGRNEHAQTSCRLCRGASRKEQVKAFQRATIHCTRGHLAKFRGEIRSRSKISFRRRELTSYASSILTSQMSFCTEFKCSTTLLCPKTCRSATRYSNNVPSSPRGPGNDP